ncbi:MAG: acyltransferase family protein [Prevotella sp.]|nr:acyltransferase family protein [Prevotellaceae bacterium]MDY3935558.1 acyltransferase family protein [Prevotella sp.]
MKFIKKERSSNIELLRIFAIFFVLICHSLIKIAGVPTTEEIINAPFNSFFQILIYSISIAGVDIFILISGWFGIRYSKNGILKLLFHIFFLLGNIYLFFILIGSAKINLNGLFISLGLAKEYWFIMAYLGLYIISPILNTFAEKSSKKDFLLVLISLYIFQCFYSWISSSIDYYGGYSITFFCCLYLTARYFKLYPIKIKKARNILYYLFIIIIITITVWCSMRIFGHSLRMLRYDNPLVICSSLLLLYYFSNINVNSKIINFLALSCFSVYIIHYNPFIFPYFSIISKFIYNSYFGIYYVLFESLFILVVFTLCTFIDQIRLLSWNFLFSLKDKK